MTALQGFKTHWAGLAARERTLVRAAAAVVLLALLWWLLIAPPLKVLRSSAQRHAQVGAQWEQMQQLRAQAEQLQAAPRHGDVDAPAELRRTSEALLGAGAKVAISAGRATITLTEVPAAALAAWLAQLRASTQAVPEQAQLRRAADADQPARWSGTLVLALPTP